MASSDLTSLSGYTSPTYTPNQPPPPPPKPSQTPSNYPTATGPPLPPPPPKPLSPQAQQQLHPPSPPSNPPPPEPSEHWLPQILLDKPYLPPPQQAHIPSLDPSNQIPRSSALKQALSDPKLLQALSHTHPCLTPSPLPPHLDQTASLATHLANRYQELLQLRQRTQSHLLHLHALERQWREKQSQLDKELAPWSAKNLYQRLREAEREGEELSRGMEGSWLDGEGEVGEREVVEFLRGFREGRGRVWRRREALERWDEGRVGGWR